MKIEKIEPLVVEAGRRGNWIFIHVHTDAGFIGLGEASQSGNDELLLATLSGFDTILSGQNPLDINSIWNTLVRTDGGRITRTAASGVEQALWDIAGQKADVPIHALFGGKVRSEIRLYANINRHVKDRSPVGFATSARSAVSDGFTAIKLAPFDELGTPDHVRTGPAAPWNPGIERVRAVREAIGDQIDLMVDCHSRMDPSEAITVGRELSDLDLMWYEEPVSHKHPDQMALVSQALDMPTASAESVFGIEDFRPFLEKRIVDVLMPDVKHCGGLAELGNIAHAARMHDLLIAPHNPSGPVANMASCHICSTLPNFLVLEYAWNEVPWRSDLIEPSEHIVDGMLPVPERPGLGYRLNMETVEKHRL